MTKDIRAMFVGGFLLLLLLAACAVPTRPQEQFQSVNFDYMQRLRWHDYHGVARHMAEEHREEFLNRFLHLDDLHVTDVRLDSLEVREKDRIVTHLVLEYYLLPSATVKTLPLRQEWVHDPSVGWRMVTAVPPLR